MFSLCEIRWIRSKLVRIDAMADYFEWTAADKQMYAEELDQVIAESDLSALKGGE